MSRFSRTSPCTALDRPLVRMGNSRSQSSRALPGTVPSAQPWSCQWIHVRLPQEAVTGISPLYREETWLQRSSH